MFDRAFDRTLSYRLSAAYDCWGNRRSLRRGSRNGIWFLDAAGTDEPPHDNGDGDDRPSVRKRQLALLRRSREFTAIELATLHALVVERLTIPDIAIRDGCSRQAVMARLVGNSRGQGGILRKARRYFRNVPFVNGEYIGRDGEPAGPQEPVHRAARRREHAPRSLAPRTTRR